MTFLGRDTMKRTLSYLCVALIVAIVFGLAGCTGEAYTQEEMDQITQTGMEMMRAWLDENMPEAEIEKCEALSLWSYDHTTYLTDYVSGSILYEGEKRSFSIHTVTGQVYFNHRQQEFADAVRAYLCEASGIPIETEEDDFLCAYMAPICAHDPEGNAKFGCNYLDLGIPAEIQDIEAFVRDPESRLQIDVIWTKPSPPEGTDLSACNLTLFRDLRQSCGLRIDNINMDNGSCYFTLEDGTEAAFGEYGNWYEEDGLWFRGPVRVRWETLDKQTNEVTEYRWAFDRAADLNVEQTGTGWIFTISDHAWGYDFQVYTEEGSEYLQHDYLLLCADWEPENEKKGILMSWAKQSDGTYKLVHGESGQSKPLDDGRLEQFE